MDNTVYTLNLSTELWSGKNMLSQWHNNIYFYGVNLSTICMNELERHVFTLPRLARPRHACETHARTRTVLTYKYTLQATRRGEPYCTAQTL
jgi:hypothetical protein